MKKLPTQKFQTHIAEPKWQQIASIIIALVIGGVWLFFILSIKHK